MKKVVFAGAAINEHCLEASYRRAFERLGFEVHWFDTVSAQRKYIRLGKAGQYLNDFIGIQPWIKKMQREFAVQTKNLRPDLILVFCNARIHVNVLAFLKSVLPAKIVLIWPDTLFNIEAHVAQSAALYDGLASYSREAVPVFRRLGFSRVEWIPLAADELLHGGFEVPEQFRYDLTFIGNARPERIRMLESLTRHFPALKMGIWGGGWRNVSPALKPFVTEKHVYGREFAGLMNASGITLNVIDDTNYPSANMRFFEAPICRSLQLSSACPEWEDEYRDLRHLAYFHNEEELLAKTEHLLTHAQAGREIREAAYALTTERHTYYHRAQQIIQHFL